MTQTNAAGRPAVGRTHKDNHVTFLNLYIDVGIEVSVKQTVGRHPVADINFYFLNRLHVIANRLSCYSKAYFGKANCVVIYRNYLSSTGCIIIYLLFCVNITYGIQKVLIFYIAYYNSKRGVEVIFMAI